MRKSKFSESQIVGILKDAESGMRWRTCCGSTASARPRSLSGGTSTAVRRLAGSNSGSSTIRPRSPQMHNAPSFHGKLRSPAGAQGRRLLTGE